MVMTADEYRAALATIGYGQVAFAKLVGSSPRTGQKWALGETRVPGTVAIILRLLLARPELVSVIEIMGAPPPRARKSRAGRKPSGASKPQPKPKKAENDSVA